MQSCEELRSCEDNESESAVAVSSATAPDRGGEFSKQPEFTLNEQTREAIKPEPFEIHPLFTPLNGGDLSEAARETAVPERMFDTFWEEGDLAVLFGERAVGKSILAVQIADALTRGKTPLLERRVAAKLTGW